MSESGLTDSFGRRHRDLRISLTDRCNLRCVYCLPESGTTWLPRPELLTAEEILRVARLAVAAGVVEIRLTGGEPLLRPDLVEIVARLVELGPEVSMTTNGIGLAPLAPGLRAAGLTRVNISLDTLEPEVFVALTRRNRLAEVLDGFAAVAAAGFTGTKANAVLVRGVNDSSATDLVVWAKDAGVELRFIEEMPLDASGHWSRSEMVTTDEVLVELAKRFTLVPLPDRGSAPAERYLVDGGPQVIGFISSVTRPFCGACDRLRLTADGQLRNCLFATTETDLRGLLREGGADAEILAAIQGSVAAKWPGHGINDPAFLRPARPMNAIGG